VSNKSSTSKVVTLRFSQAEYQEILREANRTKLTVSAYIRSCTLMRIAGDLVEKKVTENEYVRRNITMKTLDERGTF
jgi:hypothetical protein